MPKNFKVTLGTRDSDNVLTTEEVKVRAGAPYYTPPEVSFLFPSTVIPREGTPTGPQWTTGEHWAFLPCRVVPTPNEDGTGRFFVQYYYSGVHWPNTPSRKFTQTFDGVATTLAEEFLSGNITTLEINSGGGVGASGFCKSSDVSGLRRAIIVTNADLSSSFNGNALGGSRMGFRNPTVDGDDVFAAYTHSTTENELRTLERMDLAYDSAGARKLWPAGSQVIAHPYHYVPLYRNEQAYAVSGTPSIAVIEEGRQFPLTGLFNVSGVIVSGLFSRLLNEVASGVTSGIPIIGTNASGMAVRFNGAGDWYIVHSVANGSGMRIYDYSLNPQIVSGSAEAIPYAFGSAWVNVGPGLVGCGDWDIALSPDVVDGSAVPNLLVPFTANTIVLAAGGAISGTASYRWEVQPLNSGITTITNSGNAIIVDFRAGTPVDVRVFVSGAGQAGCVHSDSTGYIKLKQAINALAWYNYDSWFSTWDGTYAHYHNYDIVTPSFSNFDTTLYFHHQLYKFYPHQADLFTQYLTGNTQLQVKSGNIDNWPSTGTFIIATTLTSTNKRLICFTYDGKSTSAAGHFLTGVLPVGGVTIDRFNNIQIILTSLIGIAIAANSLTDVYMPSIGNFPATFVTSLVNTKTVRISGPSPFNLRAIDFTTYNKAWLIQPGQTLTAVTITNSIWPLLTFKDALPNWVTNGTMVVMAPWNSQFGGLAETKAPANQWNVGNTSCLVIGNSSAGEWVNNVTAFSMTLTDFTSKVSSNGTSPPIWVNLPPRGKIVVPNVDRTKTVVFSYTGYTTPLVINNVRTLTLQNCRVIQPNGSNTAASGFIRTPQYCFPYRETALDPTPNVYHYAGTSTQPTHSVQDAGVVPYLLGFNILIADVILANRFATSTLTGTEGTPYYPMLWEKQGVVNFPSNGIALDTPIYRDFGPTLSTGATTGGTGPGGCLASWTLVSILHADGFAKDVPISEVKIGDKIASMDRITYARKWCEVTDVRSLKASEAFELVTLTGKSIKVTGKHPISTCNERQWTPVEELEVGTWIETEDGPELLAKSIKDTQYLTVYDLTVDDLHTFIAGGILVHNKYKQNV
jgi:hypothetical protein